MNETNRSLLATFQLVLVAVLVALLVISANLKLVVGPVPLTMQPLLVILSGVLLGRKGWLAVTIYLLMGLAGFPFFTTGGGPAYIFKPSFGFLLGFVPAAFLAGWFTELKLFKGAAWNVLLGSVLGMIVVYLVGLGYIPLAGTLFGSPVAVMAQILPTLPAMILGDLIKIAVVTSIAPVLLKELGKAKQFLAGGRQLEESGR
jgi:biotin transport system substrate-specific component